MAARPVRSGAAPRPRRPGSPATDDAARARAATRGATGPSSNVRASPRAPGAGFTCIHCSRFVPAMAWGTKHRNHCPACLWSRHVDEHIGDRRSPCAGPMAPVALEVRDDAEWAIIHRCQTCGHMRTNRVAGDDHELALLALALRPLAHPAFPLDRLEPR